jgi:hypothetical protein
MSLTASASQRIGSQNNDLHADYRTHVHVHIHFINSLKFHIRHITSCSFLFYTSPSFFGEWQPGLPHFSYLLNDTIFRKMYLIWNVWLFSTLSCETCSISGSIRRDTITNARRCSCEVPDIFWPILTKSAFCRRSFRKEYLTTKCHKILSSERRVVQYEQTDVTKLTFAFENSVNAPKVFSGHFLPPVSL